jgi:hypothetical protein
VFRDGPDAVADERGVDPRLDGCLVAPERARDVRTVEHPEPVDVAVFAGDPDAVLAGLDVEPLDDVRERVAPEDQRLALSAARRARDPAELELPEVQRRPADRVVDAEVTRVEDVVEPAGRRRVRRPVVRRDGERTAVVRVGEVVAPQSEEHPVALPLKPDPRYLDIEEVASRRVGEREAVPGAGPEIEHARAQPGAADRKIVPDGVVLRQVDPRRLAIVRPGRYSDDPAAGVIEAPKRVLPVAVPERHDSRCVGHDGAPGAAPMTIEPLFPCSVADVTRRRRRRPLAVEGPATPRASIPGRAPPAEHATNYKRGGTPIE